jgi:hypothetical protein
MGQARGVKPGRRPEHRAEQGERHHGKGDHAGETPAGGIGPERGRPFQRPALALLRRPDALAQRVHHHLPLAGAHQSRRGCGALARMRVERALELRLLAPRQCGNDLALRNSRPPVGGRNGA